MRNSSEIYSRVRKANFKSGNTESKIPSNHIYSQVKNNNIIRMLNLQDKNLFNEVLPLSPVFGPNHKKHHIR